MEQIWENCRTYNEEGEKILEMCTQAEQLVRRLWDKAGLPAKAATAGPAAPAVAAPAVASGAAAKVPTKQRPNKRKVDVSVPEQPQDSGKQKRLKIVMSGTESADAAAASSRRSNRTGGFLWPLLLVTNGFMV